MLNHAMIVNLIAALTKTPMDYQFTVSSVLKNQNFRMFFVYVECGHRNGLRYRMQQLVEEKVIVFSKK
jgi:hypothetical protein